ncbi:hypothetical protein [Solirubrobacter ginsenosidimutans]|uniref:hypothetical protein n=1 Tax=Solirubrobacter ginsenosidimutans TaxID=490573 RepID=UPI0022CDBD7E|nr:hypothetical protein [Solirubrobacter ginsenosidimutans]
MTRWMYSGGEPLIELLSILVVIAIAALAVGGALAGIAHLIRRGDPPDEPGSDADDRGGGSPRPDPPCPTRGGDPAWWPEFEREFANYAAAVRSTESGTADSPANARARADQACAPSRSPRRRTGDRRASRSRPRRRRERTAACRRRQR